MERISILCPSRLIGLLSIFIIVQISFIVFLFVDDLYYPLGWIFFIILFASLARLYKLLRLKIVYIGDCLLLKDREGEIRYNWSQVVSISGSYGLCVLDSEVICLTVRDGQNCQRKHFFIPDYKGFSGSKSSRKQAVDKLNKKLLEAKLGNGLNR